MGVETDKLRLQNRRRGIHLTRIPILLWGSLFWYGDLGIPVLIRGSPNWFGDSRIGSGILATRIPIVIW